MSMSILGPMVEVKEGIALQSKALRNQGSVQAPSLCKGKKSNGRDTRDVHNGVGILVLWVSLVGHPFPESASTPIYQIQVFLGRLGIKVLPPAALNYCNNELVSQFGDCW